jgi:starvation-inducible DNA-binding protein
VKFAAPTNNPISIMKTTDINALSAKNAKELTEKLNDLLANYQLYYQNLRGFHWNISGPSFFELHRQFETMYTAAQLVIDDLAERILTLGGQPMHAMSDYVKSSEIKEAKGLTDASSTVKTTHNNLAILLKKERALVELANKAGDEATTDMITPLISAQEKDAWMLRAFLGKNQ